MHAGLCIIYEDLSNEARRDHYRAFWMGSLDSDTCVALWGACTMGHSFTTVDACLRDVLAHYPDAEVWRYYPPLRYGARSPRLLYLRDVWHVGRDGPMNLNAKAHVSKTLGKKPAPAFGAKRDYPKIEIHHAGRTQVTTWARTCKQAREEYVKRYNVPIEDVRTNFWRP